MSAATGASGLTLLAGFTSQDGKVTSTFGIDAGVVDVAGVPITGCRLPDVEQIVADAVAERTGPLHLATVNLDFLRIASEDAELTRVLSECDHCFADGWPVLYLAARSGSPLPERVTGADLTPELCAWAGRHGWRLGFVGASPRTRAELARMVPARFGPILAGHWIPDYRGRSLRDPELCKEIRDARVDVLLVALGCPKQELWIRDNLEESGVRVAMGVGASLDFLAGVKARAHPALRALRLEWLHRLASEPGRLGARYARDFFFLLEARRRMPQEGTR